MNNIVSNKNERIEDMIYEIRGKQVMLDSDLARLYQCANGTKSINLAVKRNIDKFPDDFMFQLTIEECSRFQIETLNIKQGSNIKYLPYVFTEQGVAMLATIIHTEVATLVSIGIMRSFAKMRKYISSGLIEQKYINNLVLEHEERLKIVETTFSSFQEKNNHVFFEGQIYDAYSLVLDIFHKSKSEIIIIDNYIDKNLLDILSKINKKVKVITNKYNNEDYKKYLTQYKNVDLKVNDTFHDKFIIIDRKLLYHSGA